MTNLRKLRENLLLNEQFIEGNCAAERSALTAWLLEGKFDTYVELALDYKQTKHLSVEQTENLSKHILSVAMNMLDRAIFGNTAHRKNQRNMRFSFLHFGKSRTNAHIHMLCKSDTRLNAEKYRELLTQILQHCFDETTTNCRAEALRQHLQHSARYVTHEYAQQRNDTIELQLTNMNAVEEKTEFAEVIEKRIKKLKKKIVEKKLLKEERKDKKKRRFTEKKNARKRALNKTSAVRTYTENEKQAYLSA